MMTSVLCTDVNCTFPSAYFSPRCFCLKANPERSEMSGSAPPPTAAMASITERLWKATARSGGGGGSPEEMSREGLDA